MEKLNIIIEWIDEDKLYRASVVEIKDCCGFGKTIDISIENLVIAIRGVMSWNKKLNLV